MMQKLFDVPTSIAGYPLLGWQGLLFWAWLLVGGYFFVQQVRLHGWKDPETKSHFITLCVVAGVLVFLQQMATDEQGRPRGIPIRGYGVFLLIAIVAGVGLAVYRAQRRGVSADIIQSLALWMFAGGIIGARLFFVIQKWPQFRRDNGWATITEILRFTEGGLVVYGSLIGALLAFAWFTAKHRLPPLALADVIAPSLLLGLAIGRWGCLMNGCCYGGQCEHPWAIRFPASSPVYLDQLSQGQFDGFSFADREGHVIVTAVVPDSPAARAGLHTGDVVVGCQGQSITQAETLQYQLFAESHDRDVELMDGRRLAWHVDLPVRSLPVHPTQIYSSLNALVLLWFVLAIEPFCRRDGVLIATTLTLYPLTRALLEVIRTDEGSILGTGLTISQNVSVAVLFLVAVLWYIIWTRRGGRAWPEPGAAR